MKEVVKGLVIAVCIASSIKGRSAERNETNHWNQSGATNPVQQQSWDR